MIPRIFALLLLAATPLAAQPASDLAPTLALVQQHLRAVHTMTASFTQTDGRGRTLTGTVQLKRPGRVRFAYQRGVPLLVIGDGRALTMIDYQVRQVSRWPIGNTPLALLLDPASDITGFAHAVPSGSGDQILIEGHDPRHREYGAIIIAFRRDAAAPAGLMLEGWTVTDAQSNRTTVRLADQSFTQPIDDAAFRWTDPRAQGPRH